MYKLQLVVIYDAVAIDIGNFLFVFVSI